MPLIWFIAVVYVVRAAAHIRFLWALVKETSVGINFFHRDRCGGLREIGRLGLRNQYSLSIVGINIILMVYILAKTNPSLDRIWGPEAMEMVIISVGLYLLGAPIAFLGPLVPFHKPMLEAKQAYLSDISEARRDEYRRIIKNCSSCDSAEPDIQRMERIERLQSLVERFPVWPFDTNTLRKFSLSYLAPVLTAIGMKGADELVRWLMTIRNSGG
jgi:hypothetical protein